jgi:hypothetical protein
MKDSDVRPRTLKLLWKNIRETIQDTGTGNDFMKWMKIAQEIRARIDKWTALN